ncbi:hypothetical protein [Streptomyces sp. LN704]
MSKRAFAERLGAGRVSIKDPVYDTSAPLELEGEEGVGVQA